jgi:hypothetical protein
VSVGAVNSLAADVHQFLYQNIELVEQLEVVMLLLCLSAILSAIVDKNRAPRT